MARATRARTRASAAPNAAAPVNVDDDNQLASDSVTSAQTATDSDSDFATGSKKRKRSSRSSGGKGKGKKRKSDFTTAKPLPVDGMSDDEFAHDKDDGAVQREQDGLWSLARRYNPQTAAIADKDLSTTEVTIAIPGTSQVIKVALDVDKLPKTLTDLIALGPAAKPWSVETPAESPEVSNAPLVSVSADPTQKGFLDLPIELRLKIYREVFRFKQPVKFDSRELSRSSHFLRTCKTVLEEGAQILYGENSFHFERDSKTRGTFYDKIWKEIAYKDVRRFFEGIGPVNIGHLNHLSFTLTDGSDNRSRTPEGQIVVRKFVEDPVLHQIFRLIGANTTLKTFGLQFAGRTRVLPEDMAFLRAVTEVKCYKLVTMKQFRTYNDRCAAGIRDRMLEVMCVRNERGGRVVLPAARADLKIEMIWEGVQPYTWPVVIEEH